MTSRNPLFISRQFFEFLPAEQDVNYVEVRNGIYEGQMIQKKREGKGIFIWDDSSVYVGDWINDQPHGEGVIFLSNGCYIFGQFECGKLNGKGMIKFANESRIFGQWRLNQLKGISFFYDNDKKEWRMYEFKQGMLFRVLEIQEYSSSYNQSQFFSTNSPYDYIQNTDIPIPLFPQFSRRDIELFSLTNILLRLTHFSQNTTIGYKTLALVKLGEELSYFGLTQNGVPEGLGITIQDNILKNIGSFKQSIMQGLGRVYSENGLIFDGNFEKGHLSGLGFLYNSETNLFYEGLFYENECNKLFKKQNGFQSDTIIKHRSSQHKQAQQFNNQLLVVEIAQIILGNVHLMQLCRIRNPSYSNTSVNDIQQQSFLQNDNNHPLSTFIQKNQQFIEMKRQNLFYYPSQVVNRPLFNTSSMSSQRGMQSNHFQNIPSNNYPYEEYEFSLHEFQRQLDRPSVNGTPYENNQISDTPNSGIINNRHNQSNVQKQTANLEQKNTSSLNHWHDQDLDSNNKMSSLRIHKVDTKIQSPQTIHSGVSYYTANDTPINRTPNKNSRTYFNQNTIERKLTFSNAQSSNHTSNQQSQARNPYFQLIPQPSQEQADSLRNSMTKQLNQTHTSVIENNQSIRSQTNPYINNKTAKKQGNWLYEQIRGRSNTPNLTNRQVNNDTIIEKNANLQKSNIRNTSAISINSQKLQYSSLQNQFKSQLNMTHNSSNYSTSNNNNNNYNNNNNIAGNKNYPKSKIFNRPKSSLNISGNNSQVIRLRTSNDSFYKRSISPHQPAQNVNNQRLTPPLSINQKNITNNNQSSNSLISIPNKPYKKQESPVLSKQRKTPSPSRVNIKNGVRKQKENIKQVHLCLPSSFFN